jgi:Arc/MetJ-type ribon-helix-helix transcriptional regulator
MTVEVSDEVQRLIEAVVASRRFASAEEFVSAMATFWQEHEHKLSVKQFSDESAYEAFERLGVIGCMESGPVDLATNPIHFDGFGR